MSFLEIQNITKSFQKQKALNQINLNIEKGELICILGPSGCGKTTLLRILAGLETPDTGKIYIEDKDCTYLSPAKRNFGIVFQSYALFPNMTVEQNILFGLKQQKKHTKQEQLKKLDEVLSMVDLQEHRLKYPAELSGGQQQRTALARAVALSPSYLLLDEPLSALDAKVRGKLRSEICRIQRALGITTIMVTHDQEEALTMADRIVVMNRSVIEQVGTPKEIYDSPATPFVASFIGTMNFYNMNGNMLGIRPEYIHLSESISREYSTSLPGMVDDLEFRGSMTRVYLKLATSNVLCADIPSSTAETLQLSRGKRVFMNLPEQYLMSYGESAVI